MQLLRDVVDPDVSGLTIVFVPTRHHCELLHTALTVHWRPPWCLSCRFALLFAFYRRWRRARCGVFPLSLFFYVFSTRHAGAAIARPGDDTNSTPIPI
jgi:hypothetical protein